MFRVDLAIVQGGVLRRYACCIQGSGHIVHLLQFPKSSFTMRAWQLVVFPIGSSSSLHSAACSASGVSHGVIHSIIS